MFVVDRGFRDAQDVLEDIGIRMEMPAFMKRGTKQMPTFDSNLLRIVTKGLHFNIFILVILNIYILLK